MNFNNIIMNPPYGKNLHLKILAEAITHLSDKGKCVNLSPIRWLQDPLATYKKNSDYKRFEESITKHIENVDVLRVDEAQKLFGSRAPTNLGIYTLTKKNYDFSLLSKLLKSIINKSISIEHCLMNQFEKDKVKGWRVRINLIGPEPHPNNTIPILHKSLSWVFKDGYQDGKHWTTFAEARNQFTKKIGDPFPCSIPFKSFEEAKNFENSTKTKFMHFLNVVCRLGVNFVDLLPWMGDAVNPRTGKKGYKSEWTDEDFYQYFKITEDEQKLIEKTMEKYK